MDDLWSVVGRVRVVIDRSHSEPLHRELPRKEMAFRKHQRIDAEFASSEDHLVVEIGNVLDMEDAVSPARQGACDDIESDGGFRMPDVCLRVGS